MLGLSLSTLLGLQLDVALSFVELVFLLVDPGELLLLQPLPIFSIPFHDIRIELYAEVCANKSYELVHLEGSNTLAIAQLTEQRDHHSVLVADEGDLVVVLATYYARQLQAQVIVYLQLIAILDACSQVELALPDPLQPEAHLHVQAQSAVQLVLESWSQLGLAVLELQFERFGPFLVVRL